MLSRQNSIFMSLRQVIPSSIGSPSFQDDEEIKKMREEIKKVKQEREEARQRHEAALKELIPKQYYFMAELQECYHQLMTCQALQQNRIPLPTYAQSLRKGAKQSSYIIMAQSQLCQRLHMMGIMDAQHELAQQHYTQDKERAVMAVQQFERNAIESQAQLSEMIEQLKSHIQIMKDSYEQSIASQRQQMRMTKRSHEMKTNNSVAMRGSHKNIRRRSYTTIEEEPRNRLIEAQLAFNKSTTKQSRRRKSEECLEDKITDFLSRKDTSMRWLKERPTSARVNVPVPMRRQESFVM